MCVSSSGRRGDRRTSQLQFRHLGTKVENLFQPLPRRKIGIAPPDRICLARRAHSERFHPASDGVSLWRRRVLSYLIFPKVVFPKLQFGNEEQEEETPIVLYG